MPIALVIFVFILAPVATNRQNSIRQMCKLSISGRLFIFVIAVGVVSLRPPIPSGTTAKLCG